MGCRLRLEYSSRLRLLLFIRTSPLQDFRGRLLHHATEGWIEHSPHVAFWVEEKPRQLAASRMPLILPS